MKIPRSLNAGTPDGSSDKKRQRQYNMMLFANI